MRSFAPVYLFSALVLATAVLAQRVTTTDDDSGKTLVLSTGTDYDGDPTTRTISSITSRTRTTTTTQDDDDDDETTYTPTTTGRVGTDTSVAPMKTTTYWYDPGNGVWTSAAWTASVTAEPTVATYNVPEGTVVAYTDYQSFINNLVTSTVTSGAGKPAAVPWAGIAGWSAMVVGAVGAGAVIAGL